MVERQALKALMVEDSEDDAKLILNTLRRGGYEVTSERVETGKAMAEALARESWDIIISDYVMPRFGGLEALKLAQSNGLDLPFIVVSGKIGEETAVEAMKAGAHDYIMKNNLRRLAPAVKREIAEAGVRRQKRRADESLRRTNRALATSGRCNQMLVRARDEPELLDRICETIVGEGGYLLAWVGYAEDNEKKTVRPVARAGRDDGYVDSLDLTWADTEDGRGPPGRAIRFGKPAIRRDELDVMSEPVFSPRRRNESLKRGFRSYIALPLTAGGKTFGILNVYAAEPDAFDDHEVALLAELADDLAYGITALRTQVARRQAEAALKASEERYRTLVENAPVGIGFNTTGGRAIFRNQMMAHMAGYDSIEEFLKVPIRERYYDPEDRERFLALIGEQGLVRDFEVRLKRKDGSAFWGSLTGVPQETETGEPSILVIAQDIDARKRAEAALKASEERYR
ncbi:MAG: GAF domain-containing protein, partial [Chloroflexota bacterium]